MARHEILTELMDVVRDERRAILFSSHNTQDVEQISDAITFIDRGRIIDSSDTETFLDRWRRLHLDVPPGVALPAIPGVVETNASGRLVDRDHERVSPAGSRGDLRARGRTRLRRAAHDARGDLRRHRHEQTAGAGSMRHPLFAS